MNFVESRKNVFWIPLSIALVSLIVFSLAIVFHWMGEAEGVGGGFCEAGYDGLIKQPVNTYSNLGFIIVGISIAWSQAKGRFAQNNNLITSGLFFASFYATLSILLGPGSMAMHATTTRVGGFLDMLSMYLVASFIFSYAVTRLFQWKSIGFTVMFLIAMGLQLFAHTLPYKVPFVGFIGSFAFGIFLILTAVIELVSYFIRKVQIDVRFGIAAILAMCLAFFIWNLSLSDSPFCDPSSLIQGHGIWHLLNALSIYFLYRFYVSENIVPKS